MRKIISLYCLLLSGAFFFPSQGSAANNNCQYTDPTTKLRRVILHGHTVCDSPRMKRCLSGKMYQVLGRCRCSYRSSRNSPKKYYPVGQIICKRWNNKELSSLCVHEPHSSNVYFANLPNLKCCNPQDLSCQMEQAHARNRHKLQMAKDRVAYLKYGLIQHKIKQAVNSSPKIAKLKARKRAHEAKKKCLTFRNMPWFSTTRICSHPTKKMIGYDHCTAYGPKCTAHWTFGPEKGKCRWYDVAQWVCKKSERRQKWDFPHMSCPGRQYRQLWVPNGHRDIQVCVSMGASGTLAYYINGVKNPDILGKLKLVMKQQLDTVKSSFVGPIRQIAKDIATETNNIISTYNKIIDSTFGAFNRKAEALAKRIISTKFWRDTMTGRMVRALNKALIEGKAYFRSSIAAKMKRSFAKDLPSFTSPVKSFWRRHFTKKGQKINARAKKIFMDMLQKKNAAIKAKVDVEMNKLKSVKKTLDKAKKAKFGIALTVSFATTIASAIISESARIIIACAQYKYDVKKACLGIETANSIENLIFDFATMKILIGLELTVFEIWSHSLATTVAGSLAAATVGGGAIAYPIVYMISSLVLSVTASFMIEAALRPLFNVAIRPARAAFLQAGHEMVKHLNPDHLLCSGQCKDACGWGKIYFTDGQLAPNGKYCWYSHWTCIHNGRHYKYRERRGNTKYFCEKKDGGGLSDTEWLRACTIRFGRAHKVEGDMNDAKTKICSPQGTFVTPCFYNTVGFYPGQQNALGQICKSGGTWGAAPARPPVADRECFRSSTWCRHAGSSYRKFDCNKDGILDHICTDVRGGKWIVIGKNTSCTGYTAQAALRACPGAFTSKECARPQSWCRHAGSTYRKFDCNKDGVLDHVCTDIKGGKWVFIGKNTSCTGSLGQAALNACPGAFTSRECARPQSWCRHAGSTYRKFDCNKDGVLDHVCTDSARRRWTIIGKNNTCPGVGPYAPIQSCPGVFGTSTHSSLKRLTLARGWSNYGNTFAPATVAKQGNIVVVNGLIRGNSWGHLATLPVGYRPHQRLIFNLNNHHTTARVDVLPNGQIRWEAGGRNYGWLSLSGIVFSTASGRSISLHNGWRNYGHVYDGVRLNKEGHIVTLTGLIKSGRWGHIATLPVGYRPKSRLIFNVNHHQYTSRVDVLPNGQVHWIAGGKSHIWISLSGIAFSTAVGKSLTFASGWRDFGHGFAGGQVHKYGKLVFVSGLLRGSQWGRPMAVLPVGYRPAARMLSNVNNHAATARLDLFPNGQLIWGAGGRLHNWLSLTGTIFAIGGPTR